MEKEKNKILRSFKLKNKKLFNQIVKCVDEFYVEEIHQEINFEGSIIIDGK